jgi:sporulation protein YlmC with PRC-barrel domain
MKLRNFYLLASVAAFGLASASYAQAPQDPKATETDSTSQTTQGTTDPSAASSPAQRESTSTQVPETTTEGSPEASSASSPAQRDAVSVGHESNASATAGTSAQLTSKFTGMKVQTPAGESIGVVKNVLFDSNGGASYAVISYGGKMGSSIKHTAVPWATVGSMVKGDKLMMDRSQLEKAPLISSDKPDSSSGTWSQDADSYWRGKVKG